MHYKLTSALKGAVLWVSVQAAIVLTFAGALYVLAYLWEGK